MNVCHILPTKFLHMAHLHFGSDRYHLVLSHIAVRDAQYCEWHKQQAAKGAYVILDNGVEENGSPDNIGLLLNIVHNIGAKELVLPDAMRDAGETVHLVDMALMNIGVKEQRHHGLSLAAVAQGSCRSSWIDCFDDFNTNGDIDTVMIPKSLDDVWGYGGRFAACCHLQATGRVLKNKKYHLLGVGTDPLEVYLQSVYNPWIRSVDTALAFHAGYQGVAIADVAQGLVAKPKRPDKYFDIGWVSPEQSATIVSNIEALDLWGTAYGQHKSVTRKV